MAGVDEVAPSGGHVDGRSIFDEFTAEDEALWYGDDDDLMNVESPFDEEDVDENDVR